MTTIVQQVSTGGAVGVQAINPPPEGTMAVPLKVTLTPTNYAQSQTLQLGVGGGSGIGVSQVCAVYVDNSAADQALNCIMGAGNTNYTVKAGGGAIIPVISTSQLFFLDLSLDEAPSENVTINLLLYNWPQQPGDWAPIDTVNVAEGTFTGEVEVTNSSIQTSNVNQILTVQAVQKVPALQMVAGSQVSVPATTLTLLAAANSRRQAIAFFNTSASSQVSIVIGSGILAIPPNQGLPLQFNGGNWKGAIYAYTGTALVLQISEFSQADYTLTNNVFGTGPNFAVPPKTLFITGNNNYGNLLQEWSQAQGFPVGPNVSVEFWCLNNTANAWSNILEISSGAGAYTFLLGMTAAGEINILTRGLLPGTNTNTTGTRVINDGNWHHVAMVSINGVTNVYIDGVLDFTANCGLNFPSGIFTLGTIAGTYLGEAAIWAVPKYLGNFTPPFSPYTGQESGLFALYHLNSNLSDTGPGVLAF